MATVNSHMPGAEDLEREYALRFGGIESYRFAVWEILIDRFFGRWIPKDATVLDLGCGWGEFINQVRVRKKYAMDLNPGAAERLGRDVTLLAQDCSKKWPLGDGAIDVVFTSNFFEHLPTKEALRDTISEAFRCLRPSGRIICLGPNIKYLSGAYWDFWDHHLPLTELSLAELLRLAGFQIDFVRARFLPYSMSQGSRPPLLFLKTYLRIPLLWPIFGKQFCVVGQKDGPGESSSPPGRTGS